jgi:polysaccharide pyruvyl transferase CsaB
VAVTVLSNDPELTWDLCGLEAVPRFQVWKVLKSLWRCDALLSGGGSLLQDRTSTRSLLYYLSIIQAAELFHKPVMLYANGIGPVQKPSNRRRVRRAVERAALVTLRDGSSARELQEMGVTRPDLHVTADPVFNLPPASRERGMELLQAARLPQGSRFAVVSVRDWPGTEEFPQKLAGLCDHLRRTYGMEILFLLMQPKHDRNTTGLVRQAMEEPSYLLDTATTPRELMAVLGEAELCVAMRLHTLIFAARMAVPCIGLVYDPKVESYLQELDMPSAGHVERFDREEAIACADRMMADYEGNLVRLRQKSEALAKAALRNEELLLELLKQTKG